MGTTIKEDYKARDILVMAGSMIAGKSHMKHAAKKGLPDAHGKDLLNEAKQEWSDATTQKHLKVLKATQVMGL
jgi:hypothetical protein